MPTFLDKVGALRALFGISSDATLPAAVLQMNSLMGVHSEGALPAQVEALLQLTGAVVADGGGASSSEVAPPVAAACTEAGAANRPPPAAATSGSASADADVNNEDAINALHAGAKVRMAVRERMCDATQRTR